MSVDVSLRSKKRITVHWYDWQPQSQLYKIKHFETVKELKSLLYNLITWKKISKILLICYLKHWPWKLQIVVSDIFFNGIPTFWDVQWSNFHFSLNVQPENKFFDEL